MKAKYYTPTQVARLLKVKPHVLRYWETEFEIRPERSSARRRVYSQGQVDKLARIKFLRYHEKLTVNGAKRKLEVLTHVEHTGPAKRENRDMILWLKKELSDLRDLLSS